MGPHPRRRSIKPWGDAPHSNLRHSSNPSPRPHSPKPRPNLLNKTDQSMEEQAERRRRRRRRRRREKQQREEGEGGGGEGAEGESVCVLEPSLPTGRVKKIMKLDQEVKKVTSEALFLISLSTDLFLRSFASRARDAALARKRRSIKLEHLHSAARSHPPTSDFLLDSLPPPPHRSPSTSRPRSAAAAAVNALPPGARRIDDFFRKPSADPQ